ncbi:MAG: isochorismatase family protein [Tenuifilaceae bacterium]|jgi:nicotinamidase-related amidase|nr:isochorismatase family protein [Tenuifilaceae bacterium]
MKALLIIDMQIGIFSPNSSNIPNAEQLLHNTNRLIEQAKHTNTPIMRFNTTPVKEDYLNLVPITGKYTHS